ncbi:hypothetical protein CVT25_003384 [Psilocybe cyanescens]|uniref:BOD1/SHG1 domain-containing protein n=1 Tax=Psilocybe cyanescens TaxID=93625 RepID=A0A409WLY8_PSICY|nr:hypothetical protein CVT25_003384 [Psilocybe cyanescens]
MPIDNPTTLVEEFKKSGEFDRLRRELLAQFQQDESYPSFKEGVEAIARKRLANDQLLLFQSTDLALKELTQEIQRYPIVERAVANVRTLSDPTMLAGIQQTMQKILHDEKHGTSSLTPKEVAQSTSTGNQPEKSTQDAQLEGDSKPAEHSSTSVVTTFSEPLVSQAPAEALTKTENLALTPQTKSSSEEATTITNAPPESNAMESEPSSSAITAENSNVNMPVDDQREMTTDIEMEDVQSTHQTNS